MARFLISILAFAFILVNCSSSDVNIKSDQDSKVEIPEVKKFVLGKWLYKRILPNAEGRPWIKKQNEYIEKTKPPILYLTFREDDVLVFEDCQFEECGQVLYPYKINDQNQIEIDVNYEVPLIVMKPSSNEIKLEPKIQRSYLSPPKIYFSANWTRLSQ